MKDLFDGFLEKLINNFEMKMIHYVQWLNRINPMHSQIQPYVEYSGKDNDRYWMLFADWIFTSTIGINDGFNIRFLLE